ncbi:MAG: hypothetical protein COT91_03560 [Candidatus Doudnabacteria bacterium CG10_big_fil_rev_8_21_14_0_10_41_10]|uniref:Uncharacterized protein n=1 Tax=Candidatus Doudnabacteria bacterium CG10_big_fil_rev_8_21_14_0_10_41_10 TaxID=1974551 RepID=A0A2H0VD62_9BACT|nr:MAG: hypothetical protein COT91_03560 [Candidatus Doudnabacteria bacterium CG10_big_fil_rev_8_21_14_0_10_41_10]
MGEPDKSPATPSSYGNQSLKVLPPLSRQFPDVLVLRPLTRIAEPTVHLITDAPGRAVFCFVKTHVSISAARGPFATDGATNGRNRTVEGEIPDDQKRTFFEF